MSLTRGQRALLMVALATACVVTPLVLLGIYLGYYVGDATGYSRSILAIAFSTAGFLAGMTVIFRVIKLVVARTEKPSD